MQKPIRILLVDDNPYFLEAARDFLHLQESLQVAGAATEGREALAQTLQLKPDVILLDINLGNQSGLELIPLFKKNVPGTKIIVLTIMQDEPYRRAAMQAGADAFVRKAEMSRNLVSTILELAGSSPNGRHPNKNPGDDPQESQGNLAARTSPSRAGLNPLKMAD